MDHDTERWLAAALADVDPARVPRLRREIVAHLEDASAAYRASGLDAEQSRLAALADLGNPAHTAAALRVALPGDYRLSRGVWLMFGVLAALAVASLFRALGLPSIGELGATTGLALVLQIAILTVALSIPLRFDDLDLAAGVLTMLGVVLIRRPDVWDHLQPWLAIAGEPLAQLAVFGAVIGLLHGLLVVALRLPAALVTLVGGAGIALWSLVSDAGLNLALPSVSVPRQVMLAPTLLIGGIVLISGVLCYGAPATRLS